MEMYQDLYVNPYFIGIRDLYAKVSFQTNESRWVGVMYFVSAKQTFS